VNTVYRAKVKRPAFYGPPWRASSRNRYLPMPRSEDPYGLLSRITGHRRSGVDRWMDWGTGPPRFEVEGTPFVVLIIIMIIERFWLGWHKPKLRGHLTNVTKIHAFQSGKLREKKLSLEPTLESW